jgi:hypothetical protein
MTTQHCPRFKCWRASCLEQAFESFGLTTAAITGLLQTSHPHHHSSAWIDQAIPVDWLLVIHPAPSPDPSNHSNSMPWRTRDQTHVRPSVCPYSHGLVRVIPEHGYLVATIM